MTSRFLVTLACVLVVAVACSGDDDKQQPGAADAGAAGEAPASGGSAMLPSAGRGGASGASTLPDAGEPALPSQGGAGGASGEAAVGGSAGGSAGDPNQPAGPMSACGAGMYDAGEPGCMACPTLPSPNYPSQIDCTDYLSGERDGDGNLLLDLGALALHEPFSGQVSVTWAAEGLPGEATVPWAYSFNLERFIFYLPVEARYADEITIPTWTFSDACGFLFTASSFHVYRDLASAWQCGAPPT